MKNLKLKRLLESKDFDMYELMNAASAIQDILDDPKVKKEIDTLSDMQYALAGEDRSTTNELKKDLNTLLNHYSDFYKTLQDLANASETYNI